MTAAKKHEDLLKRRWVAAEDDLLRREWPSKHGVEEIVAMFPGRTRSSVMRRAHELGIRRSKHRPHPGRVISPVFVRDGVPGKACIACLEWKPLEKFARHATCSGGRRNRCTTCEGRTAYAKNPIARIAAVRRYQANHPDRAEVHRRAGRARRQARLATGGVAPAEYELLEAIFGGKCAYCGEPADTIDHVMPLSRGGQHSFENIVPACFSCNRSKHAKTPREWVESKNQRARN